MWVWNERSDLKFKLDYKTCIKSVQSLEYMFDDLLLANKLLEGQHVP